MKYTTTDLNFHLRPKQKLFLGILTIQLSFSIQKECEAVYVRMSSHLTIATVDKSKLQWRCHVKVSNVFEVAVVTKKEQKRYQKEQSKKWRLRWEQA